MLIGLAIGFVVGANVGLLVFSILKTGKNK